MMKAVERLRRSFGSLTVIHHLVAAPAKAALFLNVRQMPPATAAFAMLGPGHVDPFLLAGRHFRHDVDFREFGKVFPNEVEFHSGIADLRLEAGADHLVAAKRLDALGDALA